MLSTAESMRPDKCPTGHDLEWLLPDLAYCACAGGACPFLWSLEVPRKNPRPGAVLHARFGSDLIRLAKHVREQQRPKGQEREA